MLFTSCLKKFTVKEGITVKLPSKAEPRSKDQLTGNLAMYRSATSAYMVDGMLVTVSDNTSQEMKGLSLEGHKNDFVSRYKSIATVESADIKNYNGNNYCVVNIFHKLQGVDVNEYIFCNDSEHKDHLVVGYIRYDKATQQIKAEKLLETVLSNLDAK